MLKNKMPKYGIDIRDIACDGYGLTAEIVALNKYSSGCWKKLVEAWKARVMARRKADCPKGL